MKTKPQTLSDNPPVGFQYDPGFAASYHSPPTSEVKLGLVDFGIPDSELEWPIKTDAQE